MTSSKLFIHVCLAFGRPTPSAVCRQGKARTRDPSLPLFIWYTTSFMSVWCIGKPPKTSYEAYSLRLGSLLLVCYSCPDSSFYSINCKPLVSGASLHFVARCLYIVLSSSSVFPAAGLFIMFHHRCVWPCSMDMINARDGLLDQAFDANIHVDYPGIHVLCKRAAW